MDTESLCLHVLIFHFKMLVLSKLFFFDMLNVFLIYMRAKDWVILTVNLYPCYLCDYNLCISLSVHVQSLKNATFKTM